ncbi:MAG: TIM barrel protein [Promethearchaeota archaeon]
MMKKKIKFGIKIANRNFNLIPEIYNHKNIIDFIEIILMPNFTSYDIEFIKTLELPYAIHFPNSNYGIDFGNINLNIQNSEFIEKINSFNKELHPICYIVHPESGDISLSIKKIKSLKIKPIALENMPVKSLIEGNLLGYDINSLQTYFKRINNLEFCLDINHAIKTATTKKIDSLAFIKKLLEFKKPIIFHISGGNIKNEFDEHLPLYEGNYNISEIKEILMGLENVNLTFETPRNNENNIKDDLVNMDFFIKS